MKNYSRIDLQCTLVCRNEFVFPNCPSSQLEAVFGNRCTCIKYNNQMDGSVVLKD